MRKVLWLDTETTGKDSKQNDVIQVAGLVEIDGRIDCTFTDCCQPFNWNTIEQEALDVHGITIETLKTFGTPADMHGRLTKIFRKYINKYDKTDKFTLAGMKPDFDAGFMKEFFAKAGDPWWGSWCNWRHVDLLAFVRTLRYAGLVDIENDKLVTICQHVGIQLDNAHDALADIQATRAAFLELMQRHINFNVPAGSEPLRGPLVMVDDGVVREETLDLFNENGG